jgi:hypothetical protein
MGRQLKPAAGLYTMYPSTLSVPQSSPFPILKETRQIWLGCLFVCLHLILIHTESCPSNHHDGARTKASVHCSLDQHHLCHLLLYWRLHLRVRQRYGEPNTHQPGFLLSVLTRIKGIFNTTIAHASFNLYMFNNTGGKAILTGKQPVQSHSSRAFSLIY